MSFKSFITDLFTSEVTDENGNVLGTIIGEQSTSCYYKELAIQMSINLIANSISQCTCKTYEKGKEVLGENHYILNVRPNVNENSSMLWHKAIEQMVYVGEALIVNIKGSLYVADSYVIDEYPVKGNIYSNITIGDLVLNKKFKQDDVILLRLNNTNVKKLIDNLYKSYGELLEYCIERYKLDNQEKYVLELDNVKVGDRMFNEKFRDVIHEQLQDFLNNQKTVLPLYKGQTLTDVSKTSNSSNSSDFQGLVENLFKTVAQAFQIPLDLLFGKTDNINQVTKQYLTFCIEPIASMMSEELSAKLYDGFTGFLQRNYVKVDTSDIRHIDVLEVGTAVDKILASGVMSINEIRNLIGFNEINEEYADKHWMTKNYSLAEDMLKDVQPEQPSQIEAQPEKSSQIMEQDIKHNIMLNDDEEEGVTNVKKNSNYYQFAKHNNSATLNIFGDIVDDDYTEGLSASSFAKDLTELGDVDTIDVFINSYGGSVSQGFAIYNLLKEHNAKVTTYCTGFACSIASIIFLAGDERIMQDASLLMIHNPFCMTVGNASELRKQADDLDKMAQVSVDIYCKATGLSEQIIKKMMDDETWITSKEAYELGFATSLTEDEETETVVQSVKKSLMKRITEPEVVEVVREVEVIKEIEIIKEVEMKSTKNNTDKFLNIFK